MSEFEYPLARAAGVRPRGGAKRRAALTLCCLGTLVSLNADESHRPSGSLASIPPAEAAPLSASRGPAGRILVAPPEILDPDAPRDLWSATLRLRNVTIEPAVPEPPSRAPAPALAAAPPAAAEPAPAAEPALPAALFGGTSLIDWSGSAGLRASLEPPARMPEVAPAAAPTASPEAPPTAAARAPEQAAAASPESVAPPEPASPAQPAGARDTPTATRGIEMASLDAAVPLPPAAPTSAAARLAAPEPGAHADGPEAAKAPPAPRLTGRWAPAAGACSNRKGRTGYLPLVIGARGARAGDASCQFGRTAQAGKSWTIAASCRDGAERWSANIRLTVVGRQLTWASERGTQTYTRCD
jgi:hypothetical protein